MKACAHLPFLDVVRVSACFLVILVHVAAEHFEHFSDYWLVYAAYDSLARMGAPLFFMISGYLLLESDISRLGHFYLRRFTRILLPFAVICVIYYFTPAYTDYSVGAYIVHICTHWVDYHLWYIYYLIPIYLALPFLIKIIHGADGLKLAWLFTSLWFISCVCAAWYFDGIKFEPDLALTWGLRSFFAGFLGYLVCGWLLMRGRDILSPWLAWPAAAAVVGATAGIVWATWALSRQADAPNVMFFNYLSPLVFAQTIAFFLFCSFIRVEFPLFRDLADKSFWIYLLHLIYLRFVYAIWPPLPVLAAIWMIPLYALAVFWLSYLTAIPLRGMETWLLRLSRRLFAS